MNNIILAKSGEVVLKVNRVTGERLIDSLGDDYEYVDDWYYHEYLRLQDKGSKNIKRDDNDYANGDSYIDIITKKEFDNYNGFDDFYGEKYEYYYEEEYDDKEIINEALYSNSIDCSFVLAVTPKYYYSVVPIDVNLYKCDNCGIPFCDYRGLYHSYWLRRKDNLDTCYECSQAKYRLRCRKLSFSNYYNGVIASKCQIYIADLIGGKLNHPLENYFLDILWGDNTVIEYDGSGHRLNVRYGKLTDKEFDMKEIEREEDIIKNGYKIIRIISNDDRLPSDNDLLIALEKSLTELKNNNLSTIEVSDDNFSSLRIISDKEIIEIQEKEDNYT